MFAKLKTDAEKLDKFTRKELGMSRGNQYDFVKVERPEKEDKMARTKTISIMGKNTTKRSEIRAEKTS